MTDLATKIEAVATMLEGRVKLDAPDIAAVRDVLKEAGHALRKQDVERIVAPAKAKAPAKGKAKN